MRTTHGGSVVMPRIAIENNSRMSLRVRAEEKALLMRAVALNQTDLTDFVLRSALRAARAVIEKADHLQVSERDSLRVPPDLWCESLPILLLNRYHRYR